MLSFRKILVGIDIINGALPTATRQAFDSALQVSAAGSAELLLLTISDADQGDADAVLTSEDDTLGTRSSVLEIQQQLVAEAARHNVRATALSAHGKSWYEIIRAAIRNEADLVVVGTRNKGTAERVLFGSTSMKLLRKCPCPVWVTRPDASDVTPIILAADDFSETGEQVLQMSVDIAKAIHGRLLAMHCASIGFEGALLRTGVNDDQIKARRQQIIEDAEKLLVERMSHLDHRTIPGGSRVAVVTGAADLSIEEMVREEQVSLVVMGTLGRAGLPGLLLGNTAERLLPLLKCSVLAIKPVGFISPVTA